MNDTWNQTSKLFTFDGIYGNLFGRVAMTENFMVIGAPGDLYAAGSVYVVMLPITQPKTQPTSEPTTLPTIQPTTHPTIQPTTVPTFNQMNHQPKHQQIIPPKFQLKYRQHY